MSKRLKRSVATASTPAIATLDAAGVSFTVHDFGHEPGTTEHGRAAAEAMGVDPARVFKTLVALVHGGGQAADRPTAVVGIVPVSGQLGLRALAAAVGAKRAEMCPTHDAERITGYVVGGISPFGQKRTLPTTVDESCDRWPSIFVSGGRRGLDLEIAPADLVRVLEAIVAPIGSG